jgi:hypothetical protein
MRGTYGCSMMVVVEECDGGGDKAGLVDDLDRPDR